jgi:acetyl-CoA carboxylase carboxyl transferase subunit alpha
MLSLANLKTIVIAIVIGEGSSGGALALGVGDKILMLENAIYSVLSPEGFASILWKDSTRTVEAAEAMKITAKDLYDFKVIDEIVKEPEDGGAEKDVAKVADALKKSILKYVKELQEIPIDELVEKRYQKFRSMGEYIIPEEN